MTDLPPPTLPNPSQGLTTGRSGPPLRPYTPLPSMPQMLLGAIGFALLCFIGFLILLPVVLWLGYFAQPLFSQLAYWYGSLLPPIAGR